MADELLKGVQPYASFERAAQEALRVLQTRLGFSLWMIVRVQGETGVVLSVRDDVYGIDPGYVFRWADSLCGRVAETRVPSVVPQLAEPAAVASGPPHARAAVQAYVGVPLSLGSGELFGALCALDPQPQPSAVAAELPSIELCARLLVSVLDLELRAQLATRRADRLEAESKLDPLTGLYNRRGWETLLEREEARCTRYGNAGVVISIDLDDLKAVNDRDGHIAGDRLIAAAARCVAHAVRNTDVVARLGGDEFGVLLVETKVPEAEALIARLQAQLAAAQVKASVGWAARDPAKSLFAAMEVADRRMYLDKRRRKQPDFI